MAEAATFLDAPWSAPLDENAVIAAVPEDADMSGLFLSAVADLAKAKNLALPSARPSYVPFRRYPLREHAALMVEASKRLWPREPLRQGLRKLGRGAPQALVRSMLGRVVLGSVEGPLEIMRAMAKSYPLHSKPGTLDVIPREAGRCVVALRDIYTFLDSHHVGVFEGALKFAGVEGSVLIDRKSPKDADLLCDWRAGAIVPPSGPRSSTK